MMPNQSEDTKKCPHYNSLPFNTQTRKSNTTAFIKPNIKGWLCLYDGCSKKQGTYSEITMQLQKYQAGHKIFMEMNKLEIYCFECALQITDQHQQNVKQLRKLAIQVDKEQQRTLFGANIQYSDGFIKEKAGLAGTIGNQINSYINSTIQLLAHISPIYQIIQDINLSTLNNECLKLTFETICKIRSGMYRIVQTKQIQKQLFKMSPSFHKYSNKTPSKFNFQILRIFASQFQYEGPRCIQKEQIPLVALNVLNPPPYIKSNYSPMKQLFSGQFIQIIQCCHCGTQKIIKAQFQCIRIQDNKTNSTNKTAKLQKLIQTTFSFDQHDPNLFKKVKCQQKQCIQKQKKFQQVPLKSKIQPPNLLLLEFGQDQQGLDIQYPDVLDLTKYTGQFDSQFKYEYVGSIGRANKKYYTHIRQSRQNGYKQYVFDDVIIKEEQVQKPKKIKLAIYKMHPENINKNLSKNLQSSIIINVQNYVPIPDFWNYYLSDTRFVQPLVNPFICRHGYLNPQVTTKSKSLKQIPPSIYQYFVQTFGGTPIKIQKQNQYCTTCTQKLELIRQIKQSQKQMAKFADQLSNKKIKFYIDNEWFEKWKKYLYENNNHQYTNQLLIKRPQPMNNKKGMAANGDIRQQKYKKVSPEVWYFFKKIYGGGPMITKKKVDPSSAVVEAINLRFDKIKQIICSVYGKQNLSNSKQEMQLQKI